MKICHAHNLNEPQGGEMPYGIRVRLPPGDTFGALIGSGWERLHWYSTAQERDRELEIMSSEHLYSRRGDRPTLRFEKVDPPAEAD
ncbi:MAG TPA: hypothetical protein VLD39_02220 [Gammaproteobacteria bacterium]|nr:hypothetical protein [Gammaproteobacteria bacterium]